VANRVATSVKDAFGTCSSEAQAQIPSNSFCQRRSWKVVDGERHPYVWELIQALRAQGWLWTEEYIWHKRNSVPGKWPNRLRDGWERCLHFNRQRQFSMYQDAVKVPVGDWVKPRLKKLSEGDMERWVATNGSGFGRNMSHWMGKDFVLPDNVLHFATKCGNKGHPAAFPEALPEFFIKLFTREGDLVVDPFCGSGTTGVVATRLNRRFTGFEIDPVYVGAALDRLRAVNISMVSQSDPMTETDALAA
jgi:site-specific DNA-methyltransferase (adenine-specific)